MYLLVVPLKSLREGQEMVVFVEGTNGATETLGSSFICGGFLSSRSGFCVKGSRI